MTNEITVRGSDTAPSSRVFAWPVLEAGNGSFPLGEYTIRLKRRDSQSSFQLTHEVAGAGLIEEWMEAGKVLFVCTVAAPISAYRAIHLSASPTHDVSWDRDDLGEPPKFTPMIVSSAHLEHVVSAEPEGVVPQWDGMAIRLERGSRIAVCPTFEMRAGLIGLFDFRLRDSFPPGRFKVEPSTEEGFRFKVFLAKDLYDYLRFQFQRQEPSGASIMTHIVSSALSHLERDYVDDDDTEGWQSFSGLRALADHLDSKNLGHWGDEGFDPAFAATTLYPHRLAEEPQGQQ